MSLASGPNLASAQRPPVAVDQSPRRQDSGVAGGGKKQTTFEIAHTDVEGRCQADAADADVKAAWAPAVVTHSTDGSQCVGGPHSGTGVQSLSDVRGWAWLKPSRSCVAEFRCPAAQRTSRKVQSDPASFPQAVLSSRELAQQRTSVICQPIGKAGRCFTQAKRQHVAVSITAHVNVDPSESQACVRPCSLHHCCV